MAGNPSVYGCQIALDYLTGRALDYASARTTYLALLTGNIADDALMSAMPEVTTAGYARQAVTWGAPSNARPSSAANSAVITFGPVTADMPVPVTYAALVTVSTGTAGKIIHKWLLDAPQQPVNGQALQIAIGKLVLTAN
ncbi:hypothetical protein FDA94_29245 [Herbidospora galbida]|uniref:Uncharacterized protein n=1 Tax=Herbidospora galbida TaxID=2575442 RepID=A0A4U3M8Q1_9ACTN|nr:hypothetical protein [Herbidospora galbida]TKK84702.1 hypothetical protein FDA94_29245 [Herbidospora galbida]